MVARSRGRATGSRPVMRNFPFANNTPLARSTSHPRELVHGELELQGNPLLCEDVALLPLRLLVLQDEVGLAASELLMSRAERNALFTSEVSQRQR
eukprot:7428969-Heterocapsa_arctica.AAC.1